jgi:response regulator RpfG family c-di-GMP phosphodiesterase
MTSIRSGINQRIADRLLAQGQIDRDQHARAVDYATRRKMRIEEALIELDLLNEPDLLKFIATVHATRFVSSEKLSKAVIDARVLARVPVNLADLYGVFPVLYDDKVGALSVVTADPDNDVALQEVKLAAAVREVRALAARPAAVRAAIAQHYRGDRAAFAALLRPVGFGELLNEDPFERKSSPGRVTPERTSRSITSLAELPPSPPPQAYGAPEPFPPMPPPARVPVVAPPPPPPPPPVVYAPAPIPVIKMPSMPPPAAPALPPTATPEFIEMLNVLGSLLESTRQDLRGHSATVARITRKTCERIGLSPLQIAAFTSAAYLHDLGKMGAYHLTALNVAEYEGHRVAATKSVDLPLHLTESVGLIAETKQTIASMYERYDGQGFPNGQSGKEIPIGARILSVADTYADLTQNPRNPYRKILRPFEACEVLLKYRGSVFDPNIVDLFRQAMTGEDMRAKLLSDRHEALIIDPDPEETTVLELRLIEHGFEVKIARSSSQARKMIESGEIAVVVSEIDLEKPEAGLALREASLKEGFGRDVTWVMLTGKTDRGTAQRAFDLGVDDFVLKPVSTDIFAAKLRQMIERRAANSGGRGVSGSLAEMSLPDMVQILWHGRKTCALRITAGASSGEIDFSEGQVVDARWDALRGEAAFYKMIALNEGDFRLDPTFKPTTRSIQASPEALLLEGMRRLDEASV